MSKKIEENEDRKLVANVEVNWWKSEADWKREIEWNRKDRNLLLFSIWGVWSSQIQATSQLVIVNQKFDRWMKMLQSWWMWSWRKKWKNRKYVMNSDGMDLSIFRFYTVMIIFGSLPRFFKIQSKKQMFRHRKPII